MGSHYSALNGEVKCIELESNKMLNKMLDTYMVVKKEIKIAKRLLRLIVHPRLLKPMAMPNRDNYDLV